MEKEQVNGCSLRVDVDKATGPHDLRSALEEHCDELFVGAELPENAW